MNPASIPSENSIWCIEHDRGKIAIFFLLIFVLSLLPPITINFPIKLVIKSNVKHEPIQNQLDCIGTWSLSHSNISQSLSLRRCSSSLIFALLTMPGYLQLFSDERRLMVIIIVEKKSYFESNYYYCAACHLPFARCFNNRMEIELGPLRHLPGCLVALLPWSVICWHINIHPVGKCLSSSIILGGLIFFLLFWAHRTRNLGILPLF